MNSDLVTVVVAVIGLIGTYLGAKYGKQYQAVKGKAGKVLDLFNYVYDAAKDDKITEEEFQKMVDLAKKLIEKE